MLVYFHRIQTAPGGFWRGWSASQKTLGLVMMILMLMLMECPPMAPGETYWAYVPDPPMILHPTVWESPEIPV